MGFLGDRVEEDQERGAEGMFSSFPALRGSAWDGTRLNYTSTKQKGVRVNLPGVPSSKNVLGGPPGKTPCAVKVSPTHKGR